MLLALLSSLLPPAVAAAELAAAAAAAAAAADEDAEQVAAEAAMARVLSTQKAIVGTAPLSAELGGRLLTLTLPAAWRAQPPTVRDAPAAGPGALVASFGPLVDPVLGVVADEAVLAVVPSPFPSLPSLGPQADVKPVPAFLLVPLLGPGLARADVMRAAIRPAPAGGARGDAAEAEGEASDAVDSTSPPAPLFYDWELAVPPAECAFNTGCDSEAVWFLAVTVDAGLLCVAALRLTSRAQYTAAASALRRARASLVVSEPPPPPPLPAHEELLVPQPDPPQPAPAQAPAQPQRPPTGASPGVVLASP